MRRERTELWRNEADNAVSAKRQKVAAQSSRSDGRTERPLDDAADTLDSIQGALVAGGMVVGLLYLMRITGVFPHPLDHLVGMACWAAASAMFGLRALWEANEAHFPLRWGPVLALVLAAVAMIGLLVEIALATRAVHTENQPTRIFRTE